MPYDWHPVKNYKVLKNTTPNGEKKQSDKTDPQMTLLIELIGKTINSVIITIFHICKKVEERWSMLSRDMEDVKKTHVNFQG